MSDFEHQTPSTPPQVPPTASGEEEKAQGALRLQRISDELGHTIEGIHSLPVEEQREVVESIALEAIAEDPEGKANISILQHLRAEGRDEEANEVVSKQRGVLRRIQKEVAFMCGVEMTDVEEEKTEYRARLLRKLEQIKAEGEVSEEELMEKLGFISVDPETKERRFQFPEDVFPPYIRERWNEYLKFVSSHVTASREVQVGVGSKEDVVRWDRVRRLSHDSLAREVKDFLLLDNWDVERCRKFISKMIEQRHPNMETREDRVTAQAILRSYIEIDTISHHFDKPEHPVAS